MGGIEGQTYDSDSGTWITYETEKETQTLIRDSHTENYWLNLRRPK